MNRKDRILFANCLIIAAAILIAISCYLLWNQKYIKCHVVGTLEFNYVGDLINTSDEEVDIFMYRQEQHIVKKSCFKTKEAVEKYIKNRNQISNSSEFSFSLSNSSPSSS